MSKKRTPYDEICQQVVMYGGLAMRRADIITLMRSEGHDERCISYFAFHQHEPTVIPVDAEPWSPKEARIIFDGPRVRRKKIFAEKAYSWQCGAVSEAAQ